MGQMNTSLLRYPGGKTRAITKILPLIPKETSTLFSPFFGGGAIEHAWARENPDSQIRGCDLFKPVAIFWQQVKKNPEKIAKLVETYYPLEKECFYTLQHTHMNEKNHEDIAAQFYVLNRASFSGVTLSGGMSPGHPRFNVSSIQRLAKFRMPNIEVENDNIFHWLPLQLDKFDPKTSFIYLDPPYMLANSNLYGNKGNTHKGFPHEELAILLKKLSNSGFKWILSYNETQDLRNLYRDFHIQAPAWSYGMSKSKASNEILISNDPMKIIAT